MKWSENGTIHNEWSGNGTIHSEMGMEWSGNGTIHNEMGWGGLGVGPYTVKWGGMVMKWVKLSGKGLCAINGMEWDHV